MTPGTGVGTVPLTRHPHVSLTVPEPVPNDDWCSVAEAARRLNVTPTAIRNRIKRRTLEAKRNGNLGWLVRVPKPLPPPVTPTVSTPLPEPVTHGDERVIEAKDAYIKDLQRLLTEAREDALWERSRADGLQAQHQTDQAEILRLREELRRPWWRRIFGY